MGTPDEPGDEERGPLSPAEQPIRQPESVAPGASLAAQSAQPAALGFPLRRETVTLSRVMSRASEAWSTDIGTWVLAMVLCLMVGLGIPMLFGLVLGLFDLFSGSSQGDAANALSRGLGIGVQILQALIQGILYMGALAMAIHALHGGPAQVGKLFSQVPKIWKYLIQSFVVSIPLITLFALIVGVAYFGSGIDLDSPMDLVTQQMGPSVVLAALVASPLVIYALLGVFFGVAELVYNDDAGPIQALASAWRIARGKRWLMLGVLSIAWMIAFASFLFCGIGALFGVPFALLMTATLYLGLRNGAEVSPARTDSTLGRSIASGS
jgi:hypothetical protein